MTGHDEYVGVGPLDEFPIHQLPAPVAWPGQTDRNFYDRCYLNAHDRSGELFLITGLGFYPNLGTKDAFVLLRRGELQTAVQLGDAADPRGADRLDQRVGAYRIEVVKPLHTLRVVLEETEGIALDLRWEGSFDVLQEQPHRLRSGTRVTLDAQRFAQVGTWSGTIVVDGEEIAVTPDRWVGTRDRSWGIRPVGEGEPAGKPADPPFEGFYWLYVPLRFEEFAVIIIIQEQPDGYRTVNDCHRVFADGRVEQLGWPRVTIHYRPGTRTPTDATIACTLPNGDEFILDCVATVPVPLHVGGGYGGDGDWGHGQWKGAGFAQRLTYDFADPAVAGKTMWGAVDHIGQATVRGTGEQGWGLFEHGMLGRHDPSGFRDWFGVAN